GFPPGTLVGTQHAADSVALQAQADAAIAYNALAAQACTTTFGVPTDIGGMTLVPGVYCFATSVGITGILTLDGLGNPNAVWVFKIASTLTTASGSSVVLTNSAKKCNSFWQVGSSATVGSGAAFIGNIIALTSVTLNTGASVDGRTLALNGAVTMDTNAVNKSVCECDVDGELCDDGNACTTPDTCSGGVCSGTLDCGDGQVCTVDSCLDGQCVHDTSSCQCVVPSDCEDNNPCTDNTCLNSACVVTNNTNSCDDGLFCNGADACSGGICQHLGDPCSDGQACNDICNEVANDCLSLSGTICGAADACNITNICSSAGVCEQSNNPIVCDDLNICTDDRCDPQTGCVHFDNVAQSCEDSNSCTSEDTCTQGVCVGTLNDSCVLPTPPPPPAGGPCLEGSGFNNNSGNAPGNCGDWSGCTLGKGDEPIGFMIPLGATFLGIVLIRRRYARSR
ncbi:MAG: ice-binding family protein, partial [Deltaproteobacteria bacterium]|nr:ice-binding family protein [Deltaproteobacteria bacterium]